MKLRIRLKQPPCSRTTLSLQDQQATLQQLRLLTAQQLAISEFEVSLNGEDVLKAAPETFLSDLGIVSGDLIIIIETQTAMEEPQAKNKKENTAEVSPLVTGNSSQQCPMQCDQSEKVCIKEAASSADSNSQDREEHSVSEEDRQKGEEIIRTIRNDPEAVRDALVSRYLEEPLMVRDSADGQIPQALKRLCEQAQAASSQDAIVVCLHLLMIESGFSTIQIPQQKSLVPTTKGTMPCNWRQPSTYNLHYQHESCPGVDFSMICIPVGTVLVIHGSAKSAEVLCQLQINPANYHTDVAPAFEGFRSLPKLCRIFKDAIAYPLRIRTRNALNLPPMNDLMSLPLEIKMLVLKHLHCRSLLNMAQTCKAFQQIYQDPYLWRCIYLKDFGRRSNNELEQNWKMLYRDKYVARKAYLQQMRRIRLTMPPDLARPFFPYNFLPPPPLGIIGGDYDIYPNLPGFPGREPSRRPNPSGIWPSARHDYILPGRSNFRPGRGGGMFDRLY